MLHTSYYTANIQYKARICGSKLSRYIYVHMYIYENISITVGDDICTILNIIS